MLKLQQVKAGYGGRAVISIDELTFEKGKISLLIGRNGSGKSTLLKAIAGILPYRGEIFLLEETDAAAHGAEQASSEILKGKKKDEKKKAAENKIAENKKLQGVPAEKIRGAGEERDLLRRGFCCISVTAMSHRERARKIGILPQSQRAADMDVMTLLMHGRFARLRWPGRPGKEDLAAVKRAVEMTGIGDYAGRNISALSGGERQLCYLAMVIAQDPDIFLLDEPMAAMDISHQIRIMEILRKLKESGKTIIMTSHDLPQAFTLADRIALVGDGRLIGEGTPGQLAERPDMVIRTMGASVKRVDGQDLLYPYVLTADI